jgi:hypothetical protein
MVRGSQVRFQSTKNTLSSPTPRTSFLSNRFSRSVVAPIGRARDLVFSPFLLAVQTNSRGATAGVEVGLERHAPTSKSMHRRRWTRSLRGCQISTASDPRSGRYR